MFRAEKHVSNLVEDSENWEAAVHSHSDSQCTTGMLRLA